MLQIAVIGFMRVALAPLNACGIELWRNAQPNKKKKKTTTNSATIAGAARQIVINKFVEALRLLPASSKKQTHTAGPQTAC